MWKNVHPVYGAGIRTHNLLNMSQTQNQTKQLTSNYYNKNNSSNS